MISELDLKKEVIFEELFFTLNKEEYKEFVDAKVLQGMQFLLNKIVHNISEGRGIEEDTQDINYLLNLTIKELTTIEDKLSEVDKDDFDKYCSDVITLDVIKNYAQGQLVIYDKLPYVINEIDYEDLTIHISDGGMMDNGIWVEDFTLFK